MIIKQKLQMQRIRMRRIINLFAFRIIGWDLFWGQRKLLLFLLLKSTANRRIFLFPLYHSCFLRHFYDISCQMNNPSLLHNSSQNNKTNRKKKAQNTCLSSSLSLFIFSRFNLCDLSKMIRTFNVTVKKYQMIVYQYMYFILSV